MKRVTFYQVGKVPSCKIGAEIDDDNIETDDKNDETDGEKG